MRLRHYVTAAALGTWAGLWLTDAPADTAGPGDFQVIYLPPGATCGSPAAWPVDFSGLRQPPSTFVYVPPEPRPPITINPPNGGGGHHPRPPEPPAPSPVPIPAAGGLLAAAIACFVLFTRRPKWLI